MNTIKVTIEKLLILEFVFCQYIVCIFKQINSVFSGVSSEREATKDSENLEVSKIYLCPALSFN